MNIECDQQFCTSQIIPWKLWQTHLNNFDTGGYQRQIFGLQTVQSWLQSITIWTCIDLLLFFSS